MPRSTPAPLTKSLILRWARAHRRRTGEWPTHLSGYIPESPGDNWEAIRYALREGRRGLPGGSSLARLLAEHRGIQFVDPFSPRRKLSVAQIRAWAAGHLRRSGRLPTIYSGIIPGTNGLTWTAVDQSLRTGYRGLAGGSSLRKLLGKQPGTIRNVHRVPMTRKKILAWADAHRRRTGRWPTTRSGAIPDAPGETWGAVAAALKTGYRGIGKGGNSLGRFLLANRGVRLPPYRTDRLTEDTIIDWADHYRERTNSWPLRTSGRVLAAPHENWHAINGALYNGLRGLPGGSSIARLLARRRGARHLHERPRLTYRQILDWADKFNRKTGRWPTRVGGLIPNAGGETWASVYDAMFKGRRGLRRRFTLTQFLIENRDIDRGANRPQLSTSTIVLWVRAHFRRYGEWPTRYSGRVDAAPGETWLGIDRALRRGFRGLPAGSSLPRLVHRLSRPAPRRQRSAR